MNRIPSHLSAAFAAALAATFAAALTLGTVVVLFDSAQPAAAPVQIAAR